MSANSLHNSGETNQPSGRAKLKRAAIVAVRAIGLLVMVVASFFGAQFLAAFGWIGLAQVVPAINDINPAASQLIVMAIGYILTLLIIIGLSKLARRPVSAKLLGVKKPITWFDIVLAPATYIGYLMASAISIVVISQTVPGFNLDQAQNIGFDNISSQVDLIMAFLALVVAAPIAEEVVFRGFLYGKLRLFMGAILAALLTSVLFGLVHGQWNVAIDTFLLSLAMCGLRELTGSIWAGTLVHMIKNGIAFFLLFIYPIGGIGAILVL